MRTGTAIALALAAFAAGALLTGAAASATGMGGWSIEQMWAACQGMMGGAQAAGP